MDWTSASNAVVSLLVASLLGALVGFERQLHGRWAGLRTHIMVSLGAAVFIAASVQMTARLEASATLAVDCASRVIQGIAAGVGFLGAGTILKMADRMEIKGLTTASSIWLAAAIGTASGLRLYLLAVTGTLISLVVLAMLRPAEKRWDRDNVPPRQ